MASSGSSAPGNGAGRPSRPRAAGRAIYGGLPEPGPPGFAPRLLELADELRREGLAVGTSELLDAFHVLGELSWTAEEDFREALAATLAKSQEDRRVFELVFDRFFFRAVEREAVERGLREERYAGGDRLDFDELRERIREAVRAGSDGEMRDMARLAIAAFGRQGEGSGVIGVDVQRIRRALELRGEAGGRELPDPDSVPQDRLREFERHLRRELERALIERTQSLPPSRPLRELDRALPSGPLQDLAAVHRVVAQLKRRRADAAALPAPAPAPAGGLRPLRRVDERHQRVGVLPQRAARAARLVPEAALVRVRGADQRGDRRVRARALVRGGLARDRDRRGRGGRR